MEQRVAIARTSLQEELVNIRAACGFIGGNKKKYSIGRRHPRGIDDPFLLSLSRQIRTDVWKFRERIHRNSFTSSMLQ
jgi:hypothetical protein